MANIRTDVNYTIVDGAEIIFKAPCDSCTVTGLKVYYPNSDGIIVNEVFAFKDAHGNELTNLDTFKANAMVKVILNTTDHTAYIQNADTNAYLEGRFAAIEDGTTPVGNANKLGGKNASEYVIGEGVKILTSLPNGLTHENTMQEVIDAMPSNAILNVRSMGSPLTPQDYTQLIVFKAHTNYVIAIAKSQLSNAIAIGGTGTNNKWSGWITNATTADLANYLPKNGNGTIAGGYVPLTLEDASSQGAYVGFKGTSGDLGFFGFGTKDAPSVIMSDGATSRELLHSGNCYDYFKKQINVDGRQTNIDFDLKAEAPATYRIDLATSWITSGTKPSCDGFIQTFKWDSADGYGGQLLVPNSMYQSSGTAAMQYRCCHDGVWDTSWTKLLDTRNSNAVKIQSSAPTDTSALWVW